MAECGQLQTFLEALASALVKDADGNVSINFELLQTDCSELSAFIDCENNHISPERLLVNAVGEDECGLPTLKINLPQEINPEVESIQFDLAPDEENAIGKIMWDADANTLDLGLSDEVTLQIGQETLLRVFNQTGSNITNGSVVYIVDSGDSKPRIALADADDYSKSFVVGVATEDIEHGTLGFVCMTGLVRGINTFGFTEGVPIWLSQTAGEFTETRPTPPAMSVLIGYVIYAHVNNGIIAIRPTLVPRLQGLSDVYGTPSYDGSMYKWDTTDGRFEERDEWDDLRITPGSFDRPGISDPAYVIYYPNGGGLGVYLPEFAKDDFASFTIQLPHGYKQGSNIFVHLHWTPGARGNEENGALVGWKIDYTWANINGTFSDMQTANLSDACDGTDHKHQMTPEVEITGTDKHISSMLLCNIRRTDGGADDTWASASSGQLPLLLEVDFHVSLSTIGSRTKSDK